MASSRDRSLTACAMMSDGRIGPNTSDQTLPLALTLTMAVTIMEYGCRVY